MGFRTFEVAYPLDLGKPGPKAVLLALAWHACDACGTAWPGVGAIMAGTNLGKSAVAASLAALVRDGWLVIGRFPHGGRGLSTEYVVLPSVRELSTAPCGECRKRMKNPPPAGRFYDVGAKNHPNAGGFSPETVRFEPENRPPGGHQQSVTPQQSGEAAPRADESSPSLASLSTHPADDPSAVAAAQDALRTVREDLGRIPPPTAPTRGKAQG